MMFKIKYPDFPEDVIDDCVYAISILGEPHSVYILKEWYGLHYGKANYFAITLDIFGHRSYTGLNLSYYTKIEEVVHLIKRGIEGDNTTYGSKDSGSPR